MNKHTLSAFYKTVLSLCAAAGIILHCGLFTAEPDFSGLRYYTLISNLLCCLYFGYAAVKAAQGWESVLPCFKSTLIMGITVTGLIFHVMLAPTSPDFVTEDNALSNQLLHTVVPLMSVLDWLFFDEKGRYRFAEPFRWVILPDIYFVLIILYAYTVGTPFMDGSRFPYFFIDFDKLSVGTVFLYVLVLHIFFIALGYIFVLIDHRLGRKKKKA